MPELSGGVPRRQQTDGARGPAGGRSEFCGARSRFGAARTRVGPAVRAHGHKGGRSNPLSRERHRHTEWLRQERYQAAEKISRLAGLSQPALRSRLDEARRPP
jgi:hypothetical protein